LQQVRDEIKKQVKVKALKKIEKEALVPGGFLTKKILKKCFYAIQDFHYNFSTLTSASAAL